MKSRRPINLILLLLAASSALLIWKHFIFKPEPSYNGRPLSFYVQNLYSTNVWDRATYLETTNAFFNLAMYGAPYLAQAVGTRDFKLYKSFLRKLPDNLARHLPQPLDARAVRSRAYSLLSRLGPTARSAVPRLIPLLRSSDSEIVNQSASILGNIGPDARIAVPALIALLKYGDTTGKRIAVYALGSIGLSAHEAREALPLIIKRLETCTNEGDRVSVVKLLGMIGDDASPAVPALIDALHDPESRTRAQIAKALGRIGPGASVAVPPLTEMTKDEWWYVRENAAVALGKIGAKSSVAIPALVPLQQHDPNEDVRNAAAEAIGLIRSGSKESSCR